MNKTKIGWTDYTSNPIRARNRETGKQGHFCERVSPGCARCYASSWNMGPYGAGVDFLPANRDRVEFWLNETELQEWSKPKYRGAKVFVCDMTDMFGEWVPDDWLDRIFEAMYAAPETVFQVLTKRPERMRDYVQSHEGIGWPLANCWLGVSAENQHWADGRIPVLLDTPAVVRFVSYEPSLGPVDFWPAVSERAASLVSGIHIGRPKLDWIICGGESGPNRRRFDLNWARSARDQCAAAGVSFYFKQAGGRYSETPSGDPALDATKEFPVCAVAV